jgi:hypothetical protein
VAAVTIKLGDTLVLGDTIVLVLRDLLVPADVTELADVLVLRDPIVLAELADALVPSDAIGLVPGGAIVPAELRDALVPMPVGKQASAPRTASRRGRGDLGAHRAEQWHQAVHQPARRPRVEVDLGLPTSASSVTSSPAGAVDRYIRVRVRHPEASSPWL